MEDAEEAEEEGERESSEEEAELGRRGQAKGLIVSHCELTAAPEEDEERKSGIGSSAREVKSEGALLAVEAEAERHGRTLRMPETGCCCACGGWTAAGAL